MYYKYINMNYDLINFPFPCPLVPPSILVALVVGTEG